MLEIFTDQGYEPYFPFGFHLSRKAWDTYGVDALYGEMRRSGTRNLTSAVRQLASQVNIRRAEKSPHASKVHAGELIAAGLLEDILRYIVHQYCTIQCRGVTERTLVHIRQQRGLATVDEPVRMFVHLFPPLPVLEQSQTEERYLEQWSMGMPHDGRVMWEAVLLDLAMRNAAMALFSDLFDDRDLRRRSPYEAFVGGVAEYFQGTDPVEGTDRRLMELLREPAEAAPDSLEAQLQYILDHWIKILPPSLLKRILTVRDVIREETTWRGFGRGESPVLRFRHGKSEGLDESYPEPERFTADADWMSNVVLLAKSTYVWLDQLSKKYGRHIHRLDQIPDEELDQLAAWGFTGLWFIGVWERSSASREIKRRMGNPEAMASAYSLYDYVVAEDLGGEEALTNLRERAWRRGIRLASDMVPNHVGLYSRWIVEHPDWFVQLSYPPFPSYSFNGPDLSHDERVGLFLEDGYWEHRDAAVVFKRVDRWTGDVRYIYHGNDGTNMAWNDTAQLNFLLPDVREAVIQTILYVARQFPIIRFDAAMTLSKKHYQRLWFPRPGEGGAIPSRAEYGMTREEFDAAMPTEFWRDVVERVQSEGMDTLLLAEAFWLMEGYFVRTLGMHRVYNSAFMNMLKAEENSKFRDTIKNVLEFSPQVLKRFVNFMNNPDEDTAVEQFGKGDKYFGVAMMMMTLPGLPMVGHGQIEGYAEKYGMEYGRAYWDEQPDHDLVRRHEREIVPLMHKRYLFSHVENFVLYDFFTPSGHVDENVFAYSNKSGGECALVLYNNAYPSTSGWVRASTGINWGSTEAPDIRQTTLGEALGIRPQEAYYYVFRDCHSGLEYIRQGKQLNEQGLFVQLNGYHYHVFMDFREVFDHDGAWGQLAAHLAGTGAPSIDVARIELILAPVHEPFQKAFNGTLLENWADALLGVRRPAKTRQPADVGTPAAKKCTAVEVEAASPLTAEHRRGLEAFFAEVARREHRELDAAAVLESVEEDLARMRALREWLEKSEPGHPTARALRQRLAGAGAKQRPAWRILGAWAVLRRVGAALGESHIYNRAAWVDEWRLEKPLAEAFEGVADEDAGGGWEQASLTQLLLSHETILDYLTQSGAAELLESIFETSFAQRYLRIHEHNGVVWLNKERLETFAEYAVITGLLEGVARAEQPDKVWLGVLDTLADARDAFLNTAAEAGYRVDRLLEALEELDSA